MNHNAGSGLVSPVSDMSHYADLDSLSALNGKFKGVGGSGSRHSSRPARPCRGFGPVAADLDSLSALNGKFKFILQSLGCSVYISS